MLRAIDDANPFLIPLAVLAALMVIVMIAALCKGEKWPWAVFGTALIYGAFYYYTFYEFSQIPRRVLDHLH